MGLPTATVRMRGPDGITRAATGMGSGPFDAACKAVDSLIRVQVHTHALESEFGYSLLFSCSLVCCGKDRLPVRTCSLAMRFEKASSIASLAILAHHCEKDWPAKISGLATIESASKSKFVSLDYKGSLPYGRWSTLWAQHWICRFHIVCCFKQDCCKKWPPSSQCATQQWGVCQADTQD